MTLTPHEFVNKWRKTTLKERSAAQEHFLDLCHLLDHPTPAQSDPAGVEFTFEAGSRTQKGGQGWADVWKKNYFAWEYKGKHANLDKAYQQLLQYRESLHNPPLLVVSDIDQIIIHTNFTNTVKQVVTLTLDDLLTPQGFAHLRNLFYAPEAFKAPQTTEQVTTEAAREFAKLADLLRKYGEDPRQISHFLIRILFCLFAEDIGLLPDGLFSRLVQRTRARTPLFVQQLGQLFAAMASGGWFGEHEIVHFNGRLFDDAQVLALDSDGLDILLAVSKLDWSSIEPAIFGTLFERSLDPKKRAQLGAHYTSKADILLVVEPVLMAPLRRRWQAVQQQAHDLAAKRDAASARQRTKLHNQLADLLMGFAQELASTRVLDPACGSGNFLYVALKQLLDLEKEVITFASDIDVGRFFPSVSPEQLRGIELDNYAHELAQATVWIGYIQWLKENGFGTPAEPILKPLDTIWQTDAILAFDAQGQPIEPEWPQADVAMGNPPFLGGKRMRTVLGDASVDTLFALYEGQVPHEADLVTYWFERARTLIEQGKLKRVGLLATNSIRGGANRKVLERIKQTGDIFMAWADREWIQEGVAVRVSMIGFDNGSETERSLDGATVQSIHANLTSALDLTTAERLTENLHLSYMGDTKGGAFDISADVAQQLLNAPVNPNGRPNSDVVRPWINGFDITKRPREMWIIDFGVDMPEYEAAFYEMPYEYAAKNIKPGRLQSRTTRFAWWIHERTRSDMRQAIGCLQRYIITPRVAKHRIFVWFTAETLPDSRLYVFARDDDYFFGILHSRVHEVWSLATSSRHGVGNDPTYNNTTCFETYPFPWPPGTEPPDDARVQAIAQAAKDLDEKRHAWLNPPGLDDEKELKRRTLTNLYNERPTWLRLAHEKLDRAVLDAYGWPHDLSDSEILERLLALNLERAGSYSACT